MDVKIEIDKGSGFCFGVVKAINKAEEELSKDGILYCLGDIVHNSNEVDRLGSKGLITIDREKMKSLNNVKLLLRAHGEPPQTYEIAKENNIEIIDATCPVVIKLQQKIKKVFDLTDSSSTIIIIFGKNGHAEVNGLVGQTNGTAIVVETEDDLHNIDFSKDIYLFSQTTKSLDHFKSVIDIIKNRMEPTAKFTYFDTICRLVANRMSAIRDFATSHDIVFFVSDKKSSNGKVLFNECLSVNKSTFFINDKTDVHISMIKNASSIGICGATSTPKWQMEEVASQIKNLL